MTIGENGILTQAKKATEKHRDATVEEEIAMALVSCEADYLDNSHANKKEFFEGNDGLKKYLGRTGEVESFTYNEKGTSILKYKSNAMASENAEKYEIDENGKISLVEKIANASTVANFPTRYYGKTVNYPIKIKTSVGDSQTPVIDGKWKIFYSNGTNIFLISDGYVQYEPGDGYVGIPTTECYMLKKQKYLVYWNSDSSYLIDRNNRQDSLFMASKVNSYAISKFLNTGIWSSFVNDDYADYAIGTPTLEMWVASINSKYPKENQILTATNDNGYYMYAPTAPKYNTDTNRNMFLSGINHTAADKSNFDLLYFPHINYESGKYGSGYWLASTSAANPSGQILNIGSSDACIWYYGRGSSTFGIRPVVSLNSKTTILEGTNGYDYDLNAE